MRSSLFLGIMEDSSLQEALAKSSPHLIKTFIQEQPEYLQRIIYQGDAYLGKLIGRELEFSQIDQIEANIRSLLIRLAPTYFYQKEMLKVFAFVSPSAS